MKRLLVAAILLTTLAPSAFAQATGQINGIITDASGGVLPGVTIEATSVATRATRTAISGADGRFTIDNVPPGTYELRVWHETLKGAPQKVTVSAGAPAEISFQLK